MLRFAMCNEAFEGWSFADACRSIRGAGFTGIEIAPYTLGPSPDVRELRAVMAGEGLRFVGLHWLMVSPAGLHVTTPDDLVRQRSWEHVRGLVDLAGDLSGDGVDSPAVMVFGSPKQRGTTLGSTVAEAKRRFAEGLAELAPHAENRGVTLLVEALPADQCDVVQTLAEAAEIVREVGHPAIQTMFDTHNAVDEREAPAQLLERYAPEIRHVHVNELDGRYAGSGNYDFRLVLGTLERMGYGGWVSSEVFDFQPDPVTIANETIHYLQSIYEEIRSHRG